jgi:hypothetical protein
MSNDLDKRKEETWGMDEVRSTGAGSERSDTVDSSDTSDSNAPESSDTADSSDSFGAEDTSDTSDTSETAESSSDTADTSVIDEQPQAVGDTVRQLAIDAHTKDLAVRDLHNVNVYLYESIYREMVAAFKELDAEYYQRHSEELAKNKEFFNAVFRAGLSSPQLREELELAEAEYRS